MKNALNLLSLAVRTKIFGFINIDRPNNIRGLSNELPTNSRCYNRKQKDARKT